MSFKKYFFSMLICAVTIFVMMSCAFVPIGAYADVDLSLLKGTKSDGGSFDWSGVDIIPHNVSFTFFESRRWHYVCYQCEKYEVTSITSDYIYITFYNYTYQAYSFSDYYGEKPAKNGAFVSAPSAQIMVPNNVNSYYYFAKEDTSFFGRLEKGLKDFFIGTLEADKFLLTGDTFDYFKKISHDFSAFVGDTLGITGDTLKDAIENIYNDDYSGEFWTGVDNQKIKQIQGTSNNMKRFWYDNITVVNDNEDGSSYHYDVKNYNPVNNTYPDYFYNDNYFYENILYKNDTDLDDTNNWLQKIYNAIIDLPNKIKSNVTTNVTNTYNYLFVPSEEDIQDLFSDFINTDDDGNITYSNSLLACCTSLVDSVFSADDIYNNTVSTYALTNDDEEVTSNAPKWTMDFSFINQAFDDDFIENPNYVVIDFSILDNYISTIRIILVSFSYLMFAWSIIRKEYNKDSVLS